MEFNRNGQTQTPAASTAPASSTSSGGKKNKNDNGKWYRIGVAAAVAAVVILLLAVLVLISTGGSKSEVKYVDTKKLQAVFLNTGQVYFGNIKTLNDEYVVLTNIYYLQTAGGNNAQAQNANPNVSLVKLGCELHEPFDQMVINSEQVTFWENLGENGQVAKAVAAFEKQNPEGQKCADQSSSAGTDSTNATQNAGNNSTTPATTPTTPTTNNTTNNRENP